MERLQFHVFLRQGSGDGCWIDGCWVNNCVRHQSLQVLYAVTDMMVARMIATSEQRTFCIRCLTHLSFYILQI